MNDQDRSLVVPDENEPQPEDETLSESLGGYQALIMFGVIALFMVIVFAFPTPRNPNVTPPPEEEANLIDTLAGLTVEDATAPEGEEAVAVQPTDEETEEPTADPTTEPTVEPTATPTTEEPTPEPTVTPTDEPTAVPTTEPTAEPTVEPTTEPTVEPTEAPTEEVEPAEEEQAEAAAEDPVAVAIAAGDPANGETVFNAMYETSSGVWMCASCHSVDESQQRLVGPGLWGLHERGTERLQADEVEAETVPEYVYNSIVYPNRYMVPGDDAGPYPANLMPQNYGDVLTEQELNDLTAYILTLGNDDAS